MPRILALDSATDACSVALCDGDARVSRFELAARSHTQRLLPLVDEVLTEAGLGLSELDAIAFGRGPGSFTGLRICLGMVQGLAFARDLPVIPISTLDAMAWGYYRTHPHALGQAALVTLDARMHEVYCSLVRQNEPQSELEHLMAESVMAPEQLAQQPQVLKVQDRGLLGLGSGWHYSALQALSTAQVDAGLHPRAEDMLSLALTAFARGDCCAAETATPVYLRETTNWKKRRFIRR